MGFSFQERGARSPIEIRVSMLREAPFRTLGENSCDERWGLHFYFFEFAWPRSKFGEAFFFLSTTG